MVEYAHAHGYEIDRRESSRALTVLRRGGDKIVVATDEDGHGIFFSVCDDSDNGSIIDFVQRRMSLNLGQVRKELRPWVGDLVKQERLVRKPEGERPRKPEPSSTDRQQVLAAWMRMSAIEGAHRHLEDERKISSRILADPRFASMVKVDQRGNAVFPHYDRLGISGYELKNDLFTGFAKGGIKAIWHSANLGHAPRIVVVESAIDAMSHAQITGDDEAAYISTGGSMSDHQRKLVFDEIQKASERGAEIILATDADEPGDKLATELEKMAPACAIVCRFRPTAKDWNDQICSRLRKKPMPNPY